MMRTRRLVLFLVLLTSVVSGVRFFKNKLRDSKNFRCPTRFTDVYQAKHHPEIVACCYKDIGRDNFDEHGIIHLREGTRQADQLDVFDGEYLVTNETEQEEGRLLGDAAAAGIGPFDLFKPLGNTQSPPLATKALPRYACCTPIYAPCAFNPTDYQSGHRLDCCPPLSDPVNGDGICVESPNRSHGRCLIRLF